MTIDVDDERGASWRRQSGHHGSRNTRLDESVLAASRLPADGSAGRPCR